MLLHDIEEVADQEKNRFFLWIPVFVATGIGFYFHLDHEPSLIPAATALLPLLLLGYISRRIHHVLPGVFWMFFWLHAGFFAAGARSFYLDTPMIMDESRPLSISGMVEHVQNPQKSVLRLVLSGINLPDNLLSAPGETINVRVTVRKFDQVPDIGDRVTVPAVLMPPPAASVPGGYDYARQLWFQGIGAVGYAVGSLKIQQADRPLFAGIEQYRMSIARRIQSQYPGDRGGLAAALITGVRDGISKKTTENMRDAGLAHLLAISGLHMGLFTGAIFFIIRLILACFPGLALRYPIKKWAAVIAVVGGGIYLLLSGGSIPTIRAFIMVSIVFLGVIFDRKAISLRLVALAAILLLLTTPEVLLSISFQMSFAAVTGLVFFYEQYGSGITRWSNRGNSFVRKALGYLLAILLTTVIAELTIGPIALFHFNRIVHFGLLANLVAMPVMALWVMPWIVFYLLLLPFHLESLALDPMVLGLEVIISSADYVAGLPWSISLLPAMGTASLITMIAGVLWFILWRSRIRLAGPVILLCGVLTAALHRNPDILVDNNGSLIAVRSADGELRLSGLRGSRIVREQWAQYYGQEQAEKWLPVEEGSRDILPIGCDSMSCLYHPERGGYSWNIAFVQDERALSEDCRTADVIVSLVPVKMECSGPRLILDRWDFYEKGGHFIWLPENHTEEIRVENIRDLRGRRPWTNASP